MIGFHYIDLKLVPTEEMATGTLLNQSIQRLHSCLADYKGHYAVAFPQAKKGYLGSIIRLFTLSRENILASEHALSRHFFFRDYCIRGPARPVPQGFSGSWVSYSRFRIPSKKSDRNNSGLHERRLQQAQALPFLYLSSQSTGSRFMLRIKIERREKPVGEFSPNAYGLGSTQNPVFLPDMGYE